MIRVEHWYIEDFVDGELLRRLAGHRQIADQDDRDSIADTEHTGQDIAGGLSSATMIPPRGARERGARFRRRLGDNCGACGSIVLVGTEIPVVSSQGTGELNVH
jgi:glycosyltransferase A (GT-A) superfamily protein (DUF2064 family)